MFAHVRTRTHALNRYAHAMSTSTSTTTTMTRNDADDLADVLPFCCCCITGLCVVPIYDVSARSLASSGCC